MKSTLTYALNWTAILSLAMPAAAQVPFELEHSIPAPQGVVQSGAQLGYSVATDGAYVAAGAPFDDTGAGDSGAVDVYDSVTGDLLFTLANPSPAENDNFGWFVGVSGTRVVVGAPNDDTGASDAGSVYVYDMASGTPTVPVLTLNNPGPAGLDLFGYSVAISGARVVVGAPRDDTGVGDAGSVYVYDLESGTPTGPVTVLNSPGSGSDFFGWSVSVSGSGVVVGAVREDTGASDSGRAYVYDVGSGTPTVPVVTLDNPSPGVSDQFGRSVSMSGTRVVVGAWQDDVGGSNSGSAYVYDMGGGTPTTPVHTLNNPGPAAGDLFGHSVAISGDRIVVGAWRDDTGASDTGSAYVYNLTSGTPTVPVAVLNNPAPALTDNYGFAVAVSDTRVVVGANLDDTGAADAGGAFMYAAGVTTPAMPLAALNHFPAEIGSRFGSAIAMSGTLVVVGAPLDETEAEDSGRVFVYDRSSATPLSPILTLSNPSPGVADFFGQVVSISGNRLVVGASGDDIGGVDSGRAYVYDLSNVAPTVPVVTLVNPSPNINDRFGAAACISGSRVVIGAPMDDLGAAEAGTVYVYDLASGTPAVPVYTLANPSPGDSDLFGTSVAISDGRVVVGAVGDDPGATDAGSAYVYNLDSATPTVPTTTLNNPAPAASDGFGSAVAISGMNVAVGAATDDTAATNAGSVYVYDLSSGTPTVPVVTLNNPGAGDSDSFGQSVGISNSLVVVGTPGADIGASANAGRAYLYDLASGTPTAPVETFVSQTPEAEDSLGAAVAVEGLNVAIGAPGDSSVAPSHGFAYVFAQPDNDDDGISDELDDDDDNDTVSDLDEDRNGNGNPLDEDSDADTTPDIFDTDDDNDGILTINEDANGNDDPLDDDWDTDGIPDYLDVDQRAPGTISINGSFFTVNESAGVVNIPLVRTGGADGNVSVTITTTNGTALVGSDFAALAPIPKTVPFLDGALTASVPITILNPKNAIEPNETFTVTLSNPTGDAVLGATLTARVRIVDSTADTTKPTVTITAPAANAIIPEGSGPVVTITGRALDNKGVSKVQIKRNSDAVVDALIPTEMLGGPIADYALDITAVDGLNSIEVRSFDYAGNASLVVKRSFTYVRMRNLAVAIDGPANSGSVTSGFLGTTSRQLGQTYTVTATAKTTPAPGFLFDGWTVSGGPTLADIGVTAAALQMPALKFTFREGLVLTAKFIPYPFTAAVTGSFNGLITPSLVAPEPSGSVPSHETVGMITATVSTKGVLSGKLHIDGMILNFAGVIDNSGTARFGPNRAATLSVERITKPSFDLVLQVDLNPAGTFKMTGTLTQRYRAAIRSVSAIDAERAYYSATGPKVAASLAGTTSKAYTAVFRAKAGQAVAFSTADYPQGDGYATVTVNVNGTVTLAGKLADGSPISASAPLSKANTWPLFKPLYAVGGVPRGSIAGQITLDETQPETDMMGANVMWFRPFQLVQWYPYGWDEGILVDLLGAKYVVPPATPAASVFPGPGNPASALKPVDAAAGNVTVTFKDGLLPSDQTRNANISLTNTVAKPTSNTDPNFSLKITAASGLIEGAFTHADSTKTPFQGVIFQKGVNRGAYGYFLSTSPKPVNYAGESGGITVIAK